MGERGTGQDKSQDSPKELTYAQINGEFSGKWVLVRETGRNELGQPNGVVIAHDTNEAYVLASLPPDVRNSDQVYAYFKARTRINPPR